MPTQYQLREYQVKTGEMDEFIAEWHTVIYPLRLRFGFTVVGAWRVGDDRFVWILKWEHPSKTFEEAEKAYYDSDERKGINPVPTRHLSNMETRMMTDAVPSL
ncbi:MAG: NIPSNAP family protein [Thaumarchaeota archaeon]|nr:NIPSNAP family protein [Nitrososphaerota archaeon]